MKRPLSIDADDYQKAVALTLARPGLKLSDAIVEVVAPPPDPVVAKKEKPKDFVDRFWKGANAKRDVGIMARREKARSKARRREPPPVRPVAPLRQDFRVVGKVPSFNELDKHVGKKIRFKKLWKIAVRVAVDQAGIGSFDGPVFVRFTYYEPNNRRDADNIDSGGRKCILDALKHAGVIPNDTRRFVKGMAFRIEPGPYAVMIAIRRIQPRPTAAQTPKRKVQDGKV
jgi:Holliday junction resolvase RusA-like endonuclease